MSAARAVQFRAFFALCERDLWVTVRHEPIAFLSQALLQPIFFLFVFGRVLPEIGAAGPQYGVQLPREVRDQFRLGHAVVPQQLAPGDLVFFTTTAPGASHVAIAIGGDEFIHAPTSAGVVRVERLSSSYWAPRYVGARRIWN